MASHEVQPLTELEELRMQVRAYEDAFKAMSWARMVERFHILKGIKDDLCPACGGPVEMIEGPMYPGEKSPHGTDIGPATVRLKAVRR